MRGHSILIVESEVSSFASRLQEVIERAGAQSLIVRDPYSADGAQRLKQFKFSAAVINVQHRRLIDDLDVPVVVYGGSETPAFPDVIVSKLKRLLD
jgi:hypothetical protein